MLPKASRMRTADFNESLKRAQSEHGRLMSISYATLPAPGSLGGKFAVVTPKAVSKRAVDRNLLRRRIYSILREYTQSVSKDLICAVFLKKSAKEATFQELKEEITFLLHKARLIA